MTPSGALRAAVFASVSTPQQASSEKDSLPSQLRDGQAWAEAVSGQVVATYRVPGHSRKYIFYQDAEREVPACRQLREDCETNIFSVSFRPAWGQRFLAKMVHSQARQTGHS